jgi:hypothetical protein
LAVFKNLVFEFLSFVTKIHTQYQKRMYAPYSMCYQLLRGRIPKGLLQRIKGYSSVDSTIRGILFGTLRQIYFQQNSSPYISHGTDTIVTPYDTGGIEIVPSLSMFVKLLICHTSVPCPLSERLNRRCLFFVRSSRLKLL